MSMQVIRERLLYEAVLYCVRSKGLFNGVGALHACACRALALTGASERASATSEGRRVPLLPLSFSPYSHFDAKSVEAGVSTERERKACEGERTDS